jgi:hypothetical protein
LWTTSTERNGLRFTPLACAASMPHWTSLERSPGNVRPWTSAELWFIVNQPNTRDPLRSNAPHVTVRQ